MATLKPAVKTKLKTGAYIVYIRVVHNRQSAFVRTSMMVGDKGLSVNMNHTHKNLMIF